VIGYIPDYCIISLCGVYFIAFYDIFQHVYFKAIYIDISPSKKPRFLAAGKLCRGNISDCKLEHM